jgi:nucleoside-triphosphatase THEP1
VSTKVKVIVAGLAGSGKTVVMQEIARILQANGLVVSGATGEEPRDQLEHQNALAKVLAKGITVELSEHHMYEDAGSRTLKTHPAPVSTVTMRTKNAKGG